MTKQRRLHEMVTVTLGALGVPDTSIGIASVTLDLEQMNDQEIGRALAAAFRAAHTEAVGEFGPMLSAAWAANPDRIRNGDDEIEEE